MRKMLKSLLFMVVVALISIIAVFSASAEAGNDYSYAQAISVNTTYSDNIQNYGDKDWYKFSLSSNGNVGIYFKRENFFNGSSHWYAQIYDANLNLISEYSFSGNETETNTYKIGLKAGTYFIKIEEGYYRTDKTYSFKINYSKSDYWEKENNETYSVANTISLNKNFSGSIKNYGDKDWYKFKLSSNGSVGINFKRENFFNGSSHWYAKIYDTNLNLISEYSFSGNETETNTYKIGLKAGTYFIKIEEGYYRTDKTYSFKINYSKSDCWEKENNETYSVANTISLNKKYTGSIKAYGDKDWYKINLTNAMPLNLYFYNKTTENSNTFYYLSIYDSKVNSIYSFEIRGNTGTNKYSLTLAKGTYYIQVTEGYYRKSDDYSFKISIQEPGITSSITATQSTSAIRLNWNKVSGATGYRVYQYSPSKGKYVHIASVKDTTYRKAKNLKPGTTYKFKIKAYTKLSDGTVIWGDASSAFATATECKAPKITSVTSPSNSKATVKWSNVDGETGFQLYYSTSKTSGYKKINSYSANKLTGSKTFSSSASGKTIYFKVRAYKKVNGQTIFGEWSAVKSVKLK